MSLEENEILTDALREWCEQKAVEAGDIMRDEGGAYVLDIEDFSPEQVNERKVYLPDVLQEIAMI